MSTAALDFPTLPTPAAAAVCRHCGEPCEAGGVLTARGPFCCAGCEAVFNVLEVHGLSAFYACDVLPGVSQKRGAHLDPGRFAALDDPATAARFLDGQEGGVARVTFSVPGMHCGACVWLLEQIWRVEPSILRAEADLLRRTVRVAFRADRITLRRVAEQLASIGYEPALDAEGAPPRMPAARRRLYLKLAVAGFGAGNIMLFSFPRYLNGGPLDAGFQRLFDGLNIALALPVLLYSASDYFRAAWGSLRTRSISLDVPIALGLTVLFGRSVADIALGRSEGFLDSFTGLVFFLLVGRLVQQQTFDRIAFDRTLRSFFPLSVRVQRNGRIRMVPLEQVRPGDHVVVRPHETLPADAVVLDEGGLVDYALVTGEQEPVAVSRGETVRAGGRAVGRTLQVAVLHEVSHTTLARLWDHPAFAKPKARWLTDVSARFGAWFTVLAVAIALGGAVAWWPDVDMSVQVATAVLIIACPCALTLAAPVTLGTAMGMLGRAGLYLKHSAIVLDISRVDGVVFDKTGTLTTAAAELRAEPVGLDLEAWELARAVAGESVHPVSRAIAHASGPSRAGTSQVRAESAIEVPGEGITGMVGGHTVRIGTAGFAGSPGPPPDGAGVRAGVSVDGRFRGWVSVSARVRPGLDAAVASLSRTRQVALASGDRDRDAGRWRPLFGDRMWFRQSPEEKLALVRAGQAAGGRVLMVGDGLNDAGALAAADVGIAVSDETACVVPACDAVLRGDRVAHLPGYLDYASRARSVIVLCFLISIVYNALGLSFAVMGLLTPLVTAILMPVSSLTVMGTAAGLMRWYARRMLPV
ncbi:MAG TPA: heavy metal translocating P-type ATPase metal-binding domain-containing protein [Vicinamibacterales bacterium]|nr:heavy metal translocating P-type ATPase metal-binding domain-containing protein [Vicinamibacterales bacterium]